MIFFYDIHIRILWRAVSMDFKSQMSIKKRQIWRQTTSKTDTRVYKL